MSGGHWGYIQYRFTDVVEDVKSLVKKNGKLKTKEELSNGSYYDPEYFEKYPDEKYHAEYPPEVIEEFKKGIEIIAQAQIYMQRLDWLLSGDDGEETFLERLKEDLDNLKK
jgi:hypothetical protein